MMIMKKKYLVTFITCFLLVIAGVCYSITYMDLGAAPVITTLDPSSVRKPDAGDGEDNAEVKETGLESGKVSGNKENSLPGDIIYIHLCGAVRKPSVYQVERGVRLVEVIELAGGLTEAAAGDSVNQAMTVEDGQRIYVPTVEEVKEQGAEAYITEAGTNGQENRLKLININKADASELMELPGIGQAKANSIIAYRSANGKFGSIEELMNIPGIKEGLFGQLASYITVN